MTINVIGCGETASKFIPGYFSIGVNDCWRQVQTDCLLVIDSFGKATEKNRKEFIMACRPDYGFYSQKEVWKAHPGFKRISLDVWNGKLERNKLKHHNATSPFVAIQMAWHFKTPVDSIVLSGVDLVNHPHIKGALLEQVKRDYRNLHDELLKSNVGLYLSTSYGALAEVLPTYPSE